jgi:outer membrane usher protein
MPASLSRARLPLVSTLGWLLWGPHTLATETAVSTAAPVASVSEADEISLPLKDNGFSLGEIAVRTGSGNNISLQRAGFLAAVKRVLRPEVLASLETSLAGSEFLTLKQIDAAGLSCEYDEERLELKVNPTVIQRPRGEVSGSIAGYELGAEDYVKPAVVSGYLNMGLSANYDRSDGEKVGTIGIPAGIFDGALRAGDVVVEGEFDANAAGSFLRRGTRAIYDFPAEAIRVTVGDLPTFIGGGRPLPKLAGVTIEKSYQKLQPTKNIHPTGRRTFRVERPSEIQVLLNDRLVRRLQVGPGEYDLDSLPLVAGNNRVKLLIKDETGHEEVLDFSILFDRSLLSVGTSEWSVTGGVAARMDHALLYDYSQPFSSVAYRYGLLENLSTEMSLEASEVTTTIGASAISQTPIGLGALDVAASEDEVKGLGFFGAADIEFALATLTDSASSLHLSVELQSKGFAFAGSSSTDASAWLQARASYSRAISEGLSAGVSARYAFGWENTADRYGFGLTLNQSLGNGATLGIAGSYGSEPLLSETAGVSVMARLNYRLDSKSDLSLAVDPLQQRVATHVGTSVGDGVGRWSTNVEYTRQVGVDGGKSDNTIDADFGYTGNRFEFNTSSSRGFTSLETAKNVSHSVNFNTAIAFADGEVAFGRPVHSAFALIDEHAGLEESKLRISPSDAGYTGRSDGLGPVLVSELSPYASTRLDYAFENPPAGYDTGSGSVDFRQPYKSGHRVTVGSGLTIIASGTLHDADNRPIELLSGVAFESKQPDRKATVFTNGEGVFSAQGLGPGDWIIEISGPVTYRFKFSLPDGASGEVDLGTLMATK